MQASSRTVGAFDFQPRTRVVFGVGLIDRLGEAARELGFKRTLLVSDRGLLACGHVVNITKRLEAANVAVLPFHDFEVNPDTTMVTLGCEFARSARIDSFVALGGGSSLDCAKGINFLLTNGGVMADYRGYGRAVKPLLPMIAVPTTAGTGSEGQSYALITDATTHTKMACGDPKAAFRIAILDPELTVSQPATVTATSGFDAIAHAVETYVTTKRTSVSDMFAREAWRLLSSHYVRVLTAPAEIEPRAAMQLGALYGGLAIEQSMLGATHACANPLSARYGTIHGVAIALLLPYVVRWNSGSVGDRYGDLLTIAGVAHDGEPGSRLGEYLGRLAITAGLPTRLASIGVPREDLEWLSAEAAKQWTGTFNPRPFGIDAAREIYTSAY